MPDAIIGLMVITFALSSTELLLRAYFSFCVEHF